jgi:alkanesulfonate monooxygenase SsuD/methylene tetrahydromethanopterin reductase-like flavin-dependent oxidoreductase (luciferase family)
MKFDLAINLERADHQMSMKDVKDHTLEMVQIADEANFNIVWAAEHHALEMTIAPNPFQILTWWAANTNNVRLGTAVAAAPYWHPIRLAGEAAFTDLITEGRLEFGIGSGAYQREFDRMHPGLKQSDAWQYMQETLPVVKKLWKGDYQHDGKFWQFPLSTSVPKPYQKNGPPLWVAARAPITFEYAIENECNIMSWPLTRPFSEAQLYKQRLDDAMFASKKKFKPIFSMMRHTAVYEKESESDIYVKAIQRILGQFENLFKNLDDVKNGFPKEIALKDLENRDEYNPSMLKENLMFGTPGQIIKKLKKYEDLGVDTFIYYASMGLNHTEQKKSLRLFCKEVKKVFD